MTKQKIIEMNWPLVGGWMVLFHISNLPICEAMCHKSEEMYKVIMNNWHSTHHMFNMHMEPDILKTG